MEFFTIGVYNTTDQAYFDKLTTNKIDTFCDIRQRRGVRGAKYAFVNSKRLQQKLNELKISYKHIPELAPTSEIRELQKDADRRLGEHKKDRNSLGRVFMLAYKARILDHFDFELFIRNLEETGARRVIFFCVEEIPEACHRSVVTDKLSDLGFKITHL